MDAKLLLAQMRRNREQSVDLGDGKSVTFRRPPEAEMNALLQSEPGSDKVTFSVDVEHVRKYVVGWKGFTEADLLGETVGSDTPVDFDRDLWDEMCSDRVVWVTKVARAILDSVVLFINSRADAAKNSEPG